MYAYACVYESMNGYMQIAFLKCAFERETECAKNVVFARLVY